MKLNSGQFVTDMRKGTFDITIEYESDCSLDGGYTFERVANTFELDRNEAQALVDELNEFINI